MRCQWVSVYVPPQECCGIPTLLEGDEPTTLRRVRSNLETFLNAVRDGYDLVCSCPTFGIPYEKLLHLIPGLSIRRVGGAMDCCGMGGSLGFKKDFHEPSIKLGQPLMEKIKKADPEAVITDCLSCRLQFSHALPYPVFHPLELISQSYEIAAGKGQNYI